MSQVVHLQWGPGVGHRLLAPGLSDYMVATECAAGWFNESGLWLKCHDTVTCIPTDYPDNLQAAGRYWVTSTTVGSVARVQRFSSDPTEAPVERQFQGRSVLAGCDIVVVDRGVERVAYALETGATMRLPVGARDARPQPWASGFGVVWVDQNRVYRLREGVKPRVVGTLPWSPSGWRTGPSGSALFCSDDAALGLGAGGTLVSLPICDLDSARFSDDGLSVLVITHDGVCCVGLADGVVSRQRSGSLVPVGFQNGPLVLDEDSGILKALDGQQREDGFSPCAASHSGGVLYGPGGTAWDLQSGRRKWIEAPLAGTHLVAHGDGVVEIGERVRGYSLDGAQQYDVPLPVDEEIDGDILDVQWADGTLILELEHGWVEVDRGGSRKQADAEYEPSAPTGIDLPTWCFDEELRQLLHDDSPVPFRVDGVLQHGSALWCWNDDGMLVVIQADESLGL